MKEYVEALEEAIAQYVGLPVLKRLRADPQKALVLYQESIEATMLFMDVRSFSQYAQKLTLDSLMSELNNYLAKMSEIIIRHHGFIDSLIGDEIFAIFGISSDHHADDACNTAVECLNTLETYNKRPDSKVPFEIGIGINSGKVVLGNIGSKYKLKFTAIGDNVNLAARMERTTAQYKCNAIITENTMKLITMDFQTRELDTIDVKGLEGKLSIYALEA